jgi:glycosyltransferase involved in cell wall biosynthesis
MRFSFIIPTMNEEKNIEKAIKQFKNFKGKYEVIIGDGGSKDKTKKIAKKLGAKFYVRKGTIGEGRNVGAEHAKGEILVFCDADTLLDRINEFLGEVERIFEDKRVVAALPRLEIFPRERIASDFIFQYFFNNLIRTSILLRVPFAFGQCQIVRASAFRKTGGYDKWRVHAEDTYLFKKLNRLGKIVFINNIRIFESPRRYRKFGYIRLAWKSLYSLVGQGLFKKNILNKWERTD